MRVNARLSPPWLERALSLVGNDVSFDAAAQKKGTGRTVQFLRFAKRCGGHAMNMVESRRFLAQQIQSRVSEKGIPPLVCGPDHELIHILRPKVVSKEVPYDSLLWATEQSLSYRFNQVWPLLCESHCFGCNRNWLRQRNAIRDVYNQVFSAASHRTAFIWLTNAYYPAKLSLTLGNIGSKWGERKCRWIGDQPISVSHPVTGRNSIRLDLQRPSNSHRRGLRLSPYHEAAPNELGLFQFRVERFAYPKGEKRWIGTYTDTMLGTPGDRYTQETNEYHAWGSEFEIDDYKGWHVSLHFTVTMGVIESRYVGEPNPLIRSNSLYFHPEDGSSLGVGSFLAPFNAYLDQYLSLESLFWKAIGESAPWPTFSQLFK